MTADDTTADETAADGSCTNKPSRTPADSPAASPRRRLPIESGDPTVPAFGCIVYFVSEAGVFRGRVANLAGIEVQASSQREMLGQIVAQFKSAVAASLAEGETPNWIDPPDEKRPGETKLFLPVHL